MEIILAIAQLCLTPNGIDARWGQIEAQRYQLECQQYYARCLGKKIIKPDYGDMLVCIEKKEIK